MVRFEISTSPSWKDIKIFICHIFLNINIIKNLFSNQLINSEELKDQIITDR